MSEYIKQAEQFLVDTGTRFEIGHQFTGPYFPDDKESRDVYQFTLTNARGMYSSRFGDSLINTRRMRKVKPSAYDVLACLTKYDPGTFENFCADYGYDTDSRKAEKVYFAVQNEYAALRRIFTPEQLGQLQEIQ